MPLEEEQKHMQRTHSSRHKFTKTGSYKNISPLPYPISIPTSFRCNNSGLQLKVLKDVDYLGKAVQIKATRTIGEAK